MKCRRSDLSDRCLSRCFRLARVAHWRSGSPPSHPRAIAWQHRLGLSFWRVLLEFARGLPHQGGGLLSCAPVPSMGGLG